MPGEPHISGIPRQRRAGYVADRTFEVAVIRSFHHNYGNTDARNPKTADDPMFRDSGNGT